MSDFVKAAEDGDLDEVKRQFSENNAIMNTKDKEGDTAILKACRNCNNANVVAFLLENGAEINDKKYRDSIDQTPLIIAAQTGCKDIVELLLRAGADIEHRNDQGENAFISATQEGHIDVVRILIDRVANINQPTADGETALALAVKYRHKKELIDLLLEHDAMASGLTKKKNKKNKTKNKHKRKPNKTRRQTKRQSKRQPIMKN
jgi:ankyrin repeat protein